MGLICFVLFYDIKDNLKKQYTFIKGNESFFFKSRKFINSFFSITFKYSVFSLLFFLVKTWNIEKL